MDERKRRETCYMKRVEETVVSRGVSLVVNTGSALLWSVSSRLVCLRGGRDFPLTTVEIPAPMAYHRRGIYRAWTAGVGTGE